MMIVPACLPYYVLIGAIGMIAATLFGLRSALRTAGWTTHDRTVTVGGAAITVIGWFLLSIALASVDAYRAAADRIPTIQYGILVPILIGGLLIWRSPRVARIIDAVPQHWLVGVQLYRALGVIFLILYAAGKMPGLFALPAGLGDVLTGVLAPVVAVAYARAPGKNAGLVFAWNLFGLADLVVAVTAGFLTSPSAFQLFAFDLPNELVSRFPLVLVPVFLVPVSVLLHLASLANWRRWQSSAGVPCARTTVAKRHVLRRDPGLLAPHGFENLTLHAVLAKMPGPHRLASISAKHFFNFSNAAATGLGASAPFWLEKASAFGYPSATDFEIVLLSIA